MSGPFGSSQWMYNASSGFYSFEISNSLRFNAGDSAYLHKSQGSGNRRTFTISFWVKRSRQNDRQAIFSASTDGNNECFIWFDTDDELFVKESTSGSTNFEIRTNRKFRDASAWYHIVVAYDTTDSTAGDRVKIYVNGVEETSFANETQPDENFQTKFNDGSTTLNIGRINTSEYFGGYLAEATLIDGLQLTPSSFGELKNDIWIPKNTSGLTFGTNGLRLQFKQSGTGTASASTIGADTSGNTNHLTSVNLASTDISVDSPTNNFCLPNPLNKSDDIVFSEGNTKAVFSTFAQSPNGTIGARSGKWYYEVKMAGTHGRMGFCESHCPQGDADTSTTFPLYMVYSNGSNGLSIYNSVTEKSLSTESGYTSFSDGDTLGIAFDIDNGKFYAHLNGTYYNSGDPANGTGALITGITAQKGGIFIPYLNCGTSASRTFEFNFGAPSHAISSGNADGNGHGNFEYAVPSGFLALCTSNLPNLVETIDPSEGGSPQDYFNTVLWTGNGTDDTSITGVGFQPDWVWVKPRSETDNHYLQDSVRGVTKQLQSDTTAAETSFTNGVKSFASDGFTVGTSQWANGNTKTKVAWNWKAGTVFSNDVSSTGVGSIDSSGSVNTDVGFSIIKWTAVGSSATQTIAHGLGAVPKMIIMKNRERAVDWAVYHESLGNTHGMSINTNAASSDDSGWWNDTTPTSAVFTTGNGNGFRTGGVAEDYIAYCFANVDGYSKFGLYTGNGNADGTFIHTGFRPAFVILVKTAGENWHMKDNKTSPFNVMRQVLDPNRNGAEVADANTDLDFVSNGFKMRASHATQNGDGSTYIYMAFAEQPQKYSNAK